MEGRRRLSRHALRCARLSNHRGARSEQVLGSRVARAERWRSVAAASAVVERREASAPKGARRIVRCGGYGTAPFGGPRSFSSLRGNRAFTPVFNGLWRRSNPGSAAQSLDCFVASAPRNDEVYPRVIVMASGPTTGAVGRRSRLAVVCLLGSPHDSGAHASRERYCIFLPLPAARGEVERSEGEGAHPRV